MRYLKSIFTLSLLIYAVTTLTGCAGALKHKASGVTSNEIPVSKEGNSARQQNTSSNNQQEKLTDGPKQKPANIPPIKLPGMGDLKSVVKKQVTMPAETKNENMDKTVKRQIFSMPAAPPVSVSGMKSLYSASAPSLNSPLFFDEFNLTISLSSAKTAKVIVKPDLSVDSGLTAAEHNSPAIPVFKSLPALPFKSEAASTFAPEKKSQIIHTSEIIEVEAAQKQNMVTPKVMPIAGQKAKSTEDIKLPSLDEIDNSSARQDKTTPNTETPALNNIKEIPSEQKPAEEHQTSETTQKKKTEPQNTAVPEPLAKENAPEPVVEEQTNEPSIQKQEPAANANETNEKAAPAAVPPGAKELKEKVSDNVVTPVEQTATKKHAEKTVEPEQQSKEPAKAAFKEKKEWKRGKPPQKAAEKKGISKMHTVERGDNLQSLAQKYYNDKSMWLKIYEANKDKIEKGSLEAGQVILIP